MGVGRTGEDLAALVMRGAVGGGEGLGRPYWGYGVGAGAPPLGE
jgi:hypothetical protein